MKKLVSLLLVACMLFTMCVYASATIPTELVPVVPRNHTLTLLQDFDDNYNSALWAKNWGTGIEVVSDSGSNVMKISPSTAAELKQAIPNEGVVEMNVKMDYTTGAWTHIMDLGYDYSKSSNTAYALTMVKSDTYPNGTVILQNTGSSSANLNSTWLRYDFAEPNSYFDGEWFNVRAEFAGYFVNIYINDELCIEFKNLGGNGKTDCRKKYLGFTSSTSTLYLDNITISTANAMGKAEVGAVPTDLIPELPENNVAIVNEDFDENYTETGWKNVWSANDCGVVATGDNNAYYTGVSTEVSFTGFTLPANYTVQANIFLNYTAGSWARPLDLGYVNYNTRYNLQLANDEFHPYGKIVFNGVGKTDNTSKYYYLTKAQRDEFFGKWVKYTAIVEGSNLEIYLNDTKIVEYDKFVNASGFGFNGARDRVYIDNLLVSKYEIPVQKIKVEKDPTRNTILFQDFENLESGSAAELNAMGYSEMYKPDGTAGLGGTITTGYDETDKAFNFLGYYLIPDMKLGNNYTIEMNIKLDYAVTDGKYTASYPGIKFNRQFSDAEYANRFYFNVDGTTQVPSFVVINGKDTIWTTRTAGAAAFNAYEDAGKWCYLKLEKTPNALNFYWNNKEVPAYTFTYEGTSLTGGGFMLNSSKATMMAIDNIYISTTDSVVYPLSATASATSTFNSVEDYSTIAADVDITNLTDKEITDATVIIAAYDDENKLVGTSVVAAGTIAANSMNGIAYTPVTKNLTFTVDGDGTAYSYKVLLWNINSASPKMKAIPITIAQ